MTSQIRLLNIEDDMDDVYIIKQLLAQDTRASFEFDYVNRISDATDKLLKSDFDVVLLDLHLPDSQGIDTVKTLAQQFPRLPIIVVTDTDSPEVEAEIIEAGAEDFVLKNDMSNRLLSRVIRLSIERKQLQLRIEEAALTDELTGLYTRQSFYQHIASAIAQAERSHFNLAVAFIDLDKFKVINDTHGHRVGDRVLEVFGQYLHEKKRESDVAARLGGDEFALSIANFQSQEDLDAFMHRWTETPSFDVQISDIANIDTITAGFSIGVKVWQHGMTVDELIEHADQAMYAIKRDKQKT